MQRMDVPFAGGQHENVNARVNNQITVNMYPALTGTNAKTQTALYSVPGLRLFANSGVAGACRSQGILYRDKLWFVIGASLVGLTEAGAVTVVTGILTNSGRCV